MSFSTQPGGRKALAEINITPLVDVMLVLLIIFMVTAPLIQTGVKVELPKTQTPVVEAQDEKVVLSITQDRRIFLADVEVPISELAEKLQTNAKLQREKELYVHADRNLTYGVVIEVMGLARASGIENIAMVTDPAEVTH